MQQHREDLYLKFEDGAIPTGADFADLIDSSLNLEDDGLTRYEVGGNKRFGIGDEAPASPLGIKGETGGDDLMISFTSNDNSQRWNINLNPTTTTDAPGFSIDEVNADESRLFIQPETGNVGIGTIAPTQKLHVENFTDADYLGMKLRNLATGHDGFILGHINDNTSAAHDGSFSVVEGTYYRSAAPYFTRRRLFQRRRE
jgi:hypothetical protein